MTVDTDCTVNERVIVITTSMKLLHEYNIIAFKLEGSAFQLPQSTHSHCNIC